MNVDPRPFKHFKDWAGATILPLAPLVLAPAPPDDEHWQAWALSIIQVPSVAGYQPPDPRDYASWTEWALRFNQAVPL